MVRERLSECAPEPKSLDKTELATKGRASANVQGLKRSKSA